MFKEWFTQWNIEMKESFLRKIEEIDPSFIEKLNAEIEEKDTSQVNDEVNVENENIIEDE